MAKMPVGRDGRMIDWGAGVKSSWKFGEEAAMVRGARGREQRRRKRRRREE